MNRLSVVVIGLGRFGVSLAQALSERGHEVLGLDVDMKKVEDASEFMTQAVQIDATDESALIELGVRDFDIGVVAIGEDLKSSIMASLLLKRLGLRRVIAKANDDLHGEILTKIGVDSVVYPERDTGTKVSHAIMIPYAADYLEVGTGYGVAKVIVPQSLSGKHLDEVFPKGRFGVTVLILRRGATAELIVNPAKFEAVVEGDTLLVAGRDSDLEAMRVLLG